MTDRGRFRRAVEDRDLEDMMACFTENAVLHSPITVKPFEGRETIRVLLGILLEVFHEFEYTDELDARDGTKGLIFRARVGTRRLQGLDLIRFDEKGRIADFTVMIRPRSAIEALLEEVAPRLAAAQGAA
jgi:hypothetical protein